MVARILAEEMTAEIEIEIGTEIAIETEDGTTEIAIEIGEMGIEGSEGVGAVGGTVIVTEEETEIAIGDDRVIMILSIVNRSAIF